MKKIFIGCLCAMATALAATAMPLTPEQAIGRLSGSGDLKAKSAAMIDARPVYTSHNTSGVAEAYLFNKKAGGYIILSANDVAVPLLGYSDTGTIDPGNIPPQLEWWLSEIGREIEWAENKGMKSNSDEVYAPAEWSAINPLVKTTWNQDAPYNNLCPGASSANPPAGERRTYTGCVATSMAQLMKYHNYPDKGTGGVIYTPTKLGYRLVMKFSDRAFDWDNMLNFYNSGDYTEAQAEAVAYLMEACGYSVNMNYGFDSSGASGSAIAAALRTYFKYDINTEDQRRIAYTTQEWSEMIYNNLKNIGPVVINGQSPLDGGHSFICDGYDGNGYFHFNWGWGGMADGYYSLDALNPDAQGIGGATGGFNFYQNGIFGAQPPREGQEAKPARMIQYGSLEATMSSNVMTITTSAFKSAYYVGGSISGWYNYMDRDIRVKVGAMVEGVDGTVFGPTDAVAGFPTASEFSFRPDYGIGANSGVITLPSLPDGKYRVTMVTKDLNIADATWLPMLTPIGCYNYVIVEVKGGIYTVTSFPTAKLDVTDAQIDSDLYYGKRFIITAKVTNNSDIQMSEGLAPRLYSGNTVCYEGESIVVTVGPGESEDLEWVSNFTRVSGNALTIPTEFTLALYNPETGEVAGRYGTVTMLPSPGSPNVILTGFSIADSRRFDDVNIDGRDYIVVYQVDNPEDINISLSYMVKSGYFDSMVRMSISKMENGTSVPFLDDVYAEWQMKSASDERTPINVSLDMTKYDQNCVYALTAKYTSGNSQQTWGTIYFMLKDLVSGVDEIDIDNEIPVIYYNLQGQKVTVPVKGDILIECRGEKTRKIKY